jgi:hypothetical protein
MHDLNVSLPGSHREGVLLGMFFVPLSYRLLSPFYVVVSRAELTIRRAEESACAAFPLLSVNYGLSVQDRSASKTRHFLPSSMRCGRCPLCQEGRSSPKMQHSTLSVERWVARNSPGSSLARVSAVYFPRPQFSTKKLSEGWLVWIRLAKVRPSPP